MTTARQKAKIDRAYRNFKRSLRAGNLHRGRYWMAVVERRLDCALPRWIRDYLARQPRHTAGCPSLE